MQQPSPSLCPHELPPAQCAICSARKSGARVWITGGGQRYHRQPDCGSLVYGQEWVEGRGGQATEPRKVTLDDAIQQGLVACADCLPPEP